MWLVTPRGFYSAVAKKADGDTHLSIRARDVADLKRLIEIVPGKRPRIDRKSGTDYACRIRLTREQWDAALLTMSKEVTYSNFKDEVKAKRGKARAEVYMDVWVALLKIQRPWKPKQAPSPYAVLDAPDGSCTVCGTRLCSSNACLDEHARRSVFG